MLKFGAAVRPADHQTSWSAGYTVDNEYDDEPSLAASIPRWRGDQARDYCEALWPAGSRRRARRKGPQRLRLAAACAGSWLIQSNPIHKRVIAEELPQTTRKLGIAPPVVEATTAEELDIAFASAASQHVDAMIVFGDALISRNSMRTTELAAKHRIPPMYLGRQYATGGGLISYSPDFPDFGVVQADTSIRFLKALSLPICQLSSRPNSN